MQSRAYHGAQADSTLYPSYPPVAPSSPNYQHQQSQRRYSAETNRPPSQAGCSGSLYGQPQRSPIHCVQQHPRDESEDYEERYLGEIAAANQAAQDQYWGAHAALSEAPARFELYQDQQYYADHRTSMPVMPSYEASNYDGGFYMEPPGSYEPVPHYQPASSLAGHSVASSHSPGGRSRQNLAVYASPFMHSSATSPASEPPNVFNVTAAHHLPGTRARSQDAFGGDVRAQPDPRMGDALPGFPNCSHTWYGGHLSADGHAYTMISPGSGQSGWESESFSHGRRGLPRAGNEYGAYPYGRTSMNDYVKQERIRMLENEFGPMVKHKGKGKGAYNGDEDDKDQEQEEIRIGGFDEKGRLKLPWRKTRITTRCFQMIVSLAAAGLGIGGFIMIRPKEKAPPSGSMPSFVLYGVSAISTIVCLWLFGFKPCCKSCRDTAGPGAMVGGAGNGIVIPIMTDAGADAKPVMFGKKNKKAMMHQGTTVNLIVDPSLLGKRGTDDSDSDTDDNETLPGAERRWEKRRGKKKAKLGMLGNMRLQAHWRVARTSLKWNCAWDVILCLLWGTAAVLTLGVGKKCPSGSSEGWCTLYNAAIACSIVATLLCMVAILCDIAGLRASKAPPKARV
ncbi:uncharacterized protein MEPE_01202 [Melanopsichium pennsylvanicum]|uniref:Uncharacterized protein n=2 Tax=Melanopsichium pennsylvanicum TaxID=63383 RepID=A0AAJ4XIW1_9BASI|nr:putative protein [Melanopsichium pennsylvanicum 4]SNX82496.1 uncharacterized protein MEPE_01202 [Melanopsichium pennsylvanicum]